MSKKKTYSVAPEKSTEECAMEMARHEVGSILVTREGNYVGIITEVDIIRKVVAMKLNPATVSVEKVMASPLVTIDADRSVVDANELMEKNKIRHLGVSRNGKVIGMLSVRDLLHPLYIEQNAVGGSPS
ncbi:MAG: cyclic nucleotide-binding/CBS domain-containing protein [Nitrospiria bacterium]